MARPAKIERSRALVYPARLGDSERLTAAKGLYERRVMSGAAKLVEGADSAGVGGDLKFSWKNVKELAENGAVLAAMTEWGTPAYLRFDIEDDGVRYGLRVASFLTFTGFARRSRKGVRFVQERAGGLEGVCTDEEIRAMFARCWLHRPAG